MAPILRIEEEKNNVCGLETENITANNCNQSIRNRK